MTIEAMKQALEALEEFCQYANDQHQINALSEDSWLWMMWKDGLKAITPLRQAIAEAEPSRSDIKQKPVTPFGFPLFRDKPVPKEESVIKEVVVNADYREMWTEQVRINQRLCAWFRTSQINAAQEPLTDEEIRDCLDAADQMYCEHDGDKEVFKARAIESAHGIGAKE